MRVLWLIALLMAAPAALGQPARVVVDTNLPGARIVIDGHEAGLPGDTLRAAPGPAVIAVRAPRATWSAPALVRTVELEAGATHALRLDVPYRLRLESIPHGAVVTAADAPGVVLGRTPLIVESRAPGAVYLLRLGGYHDERIEAGDALWTSRVVPMAPVAVEAEGAPIEVAWQPPARRRAWIDAAALGLGLAGGALAVHYKFKADRRFDRYLQTGDPIVRADVDRMDRLSLVSLGAMQVGLGVFAVRLVLR